MEPVSLSIGAVGLVALLTTCVECFEYIDAAKSCGRDLELLTTKFAIEKVRLLIWGESVGILSSTTTTTTTTSKVESPHVRPIVEQILNCIRMLFEDTNALTARYGLRPTDDVASSSLALTGPSDSTQHVALSLRLKASYIRFKSRVDQTQQQTSTTKKTKWAIRDRQKFTSFVEDIHQFINGLEAITDSIDMATKRAVLIREELSTVEDPEDLKLITEACADGNQQWSDAASEALGSSVCGESNYQRIREWMSANSDAHMSTVVNYAESGPVFSDLPEAPITGFPDHNHDGFGFPVVSNIGNFNSGSTLFPPPAHLQTPSRLPHLCVSPGCQSRFDSIDALKQHLRNDHNTEAIHWRCVFNNCPSRNDKIWTSFYDYYSHCRLQHPDEDANELVKKSITV
ncbi:MAG: hypothetical protein Q9204_004834 [Flavoplaca sp. TL-2023a]